jgi:hypothetical protein
LVDVGEMQSCGGLVEDVDGAAGGALDQQVSGSRGTARLSFAG